MFRQKISHHQLPRGPDSTLEGGWFWTHLDRRAEVWLSWEQSCPLNTWLLFALVTFHKFISSWLWKTSGVYLPCSGNSAYAVENSALLQTKSPSEALWLDRKVIHGLEYLLWSPIWHLAMFFPLSFIFSSPPSLAKLYNTWRTGQCFAVMVMWSKQTQKILPEFQNSLLVANEIAEEPAVLFAQLVMLTCVSVGLLEIFSCFISFNDKYPNVRWCAR